MKPADQKFLSCSNVLVCAWLVLSPPSIGQAFDDLESKQGKTRLAGHVHMLIEETYDKAKPNARIIVTKTYDRAGNLAELDVAIVDRKAPERDTKQHTIFTRDHEGRTAEGRVYRDDGPLASRTVYSYDKEGGLRLKVSYLSDGSEQTKWEYAYDSDGNEKEAKYYLAGILKARYVKEHDEHGNEIKFTAYRGDGSVEYSGRTKYDTDNRRTEDLVYKPDESVDRRRTYVYDRRGNLVEQRTYLANGSLLERQVSKYEFDSAGNWIKRTTSNWSTRSGKLKLESTAIISRTISYYTELGRQDRRQMGHADFPGSLTPSD